MRTRCRACGMFLQREREATAARAGRRPSEPRGGALRPGRSAGARPADGGRSPTAEGADPGPRASPPVGGEPGGPGRAHHELPSIQLAFSESPTLSAQRASVRTIVPLPPAA